MSKPLILTVDDDDAVTASLNLLLRRAGYAVVAAATPDRALELVASRDVSLVLQDMNFSLATTGEEGLRLLAEIRKARPDLPVLLITAWGSIELAVQGMKAGAADFVTKPWTHEQILQSVRTALGLAATRPPPSPAARLTRRELDARYDFREVIGEDPRLLEVLDLLGRVSRTDAPVLITGESGTGKEIVAEAIHRNSPRREGPFVKVNLGGISVPLFDSEMFGHVRGAFTDASRDRQGRFALAEGGTILLDEIGELEPGCQVKMLRVLQDRTYEILGSSETRALDVRVIASTNRDLPQAVAEGRFREDLLYRLNLISVRLPSLAERREDIPLLARQFLSKACRATGSGPSEFAPEALDYLRKQPWPGNVRQLKHWIERALLVTGADLLKPEHFQGPAATAGDEPLREALPPVGSMTLDEVEKSMILRSLEHHQGNISRVAESLGLSRAALYRRLDKFGIKH